MLKNCWTYCYRYRFKLKCFERNVITSRIYPIAVVKKLYTTQIIKKYDVALFFAIKTVLITSLIKSGGDYKKKNYYFQKAF